MRQLIAKAIRPLLQASLCTIFVVSHTQVYANHSHTSHGVSENSSQAITSKQVSSTIAVSDANRQLQNLLDEIWQYELSQFPGLARSKGLKAVDLPRQFTDISMPAMTARYQKFTDFMSALTKIDETALSSEDRISLIMQKYRLQNYMSHFEFKEYRVPITSEYGFHSSIGGALSRMSLNTQDDVAVYTQSLQEAAELIDVNVAYMREGMETGHSQPKAVLLGFEDSIAAYIIDDIKEHPFSKAMLNDKKGLISPEQKSLINTLVNDVNTAYKNFYNFFVDEYVPNAPDAIAATNWPIGVNFYNNRIKHYTTTDLSAEEIHQIGLSEVARIRAEMQQIVDKLEFDGDINAFIDFLRTDKQFYAETPEDLIMYASYVAKQMDAKLPKLFYKMPRTPYGVAPVPDAIAPKYTTGRYVSPNSDDEPGYYWVNTYALDKRPLYAIPALTLHEAVPGHHFQISLAAEMNDLPEVRRSTYISAFGEGWGLYSEYLGVEVGIYDDPYDDFGRLSYEMWRACRLVVDTGMHVFGWSRDKALAYMLENTALSEHNVTTEIDRYISWPAQALSYKLGEIKIKELRAKAEEKMGDAFDLRAFHDAILAHGSVPLFVLEENMHAFINGH
ncbi:DUF885 domain-containing protein [Glaciecola petra]|uniref:DUF885 domain-containing protein n=1 Tax=Glaciecola petra TaxID=3075602 RepID=A0ABU2ZYC7_9ALTE|nr:DUF885 domain-containing protein [Aestuariibacter sp. P117]MDT0596422.1 DUF885 domain-containing protein [Aestuariibacter sp. P117]